MSVTKIDKDEFVIYHSDKLSGEIELFFTSDMNASYSSIVEDNQCYIALKDFTANNIMLVGKEVINTLKKNGYSNFNKEIKIIVNDKEEEKKVENVDFGSDFKIVVVKNYEEQKNLVSVGEAKGKDDQKKEEKDKEKDKEKEDEVEEFIEKFMNYNTVFKVDNGINRSFVQRISDDASNSYMLENVSAIDIHNKYRELLDDDVFRNKIVGMSSDDVAKEVLDAISIEGNKKQYYLEDSLKQGSNDKASDVSGRVAYQNGGMVNREIGVVENGPEKSQQYTTIELDNDNVNVVNPEVQSTNVGVGGTVNTDDSFSYSTDVDESYGKENMLDDDNNYDLEQKEKQKRELTNTNVKVRKRVLERTNSAGIVSILEIGFIILLISLIVMFFAFNK